MKIMTLAAAATIALAGLAAVPALAQPPGQDMHDSCGTTTTATNGPARRDMRHDHGRHDGGIAAAMATAGTIRRLPWVWRHHHRVRVCGWR